MERGWEEGGGGGLVNIYLAFAHVLPILVLLLLSQIVCQSQISALAIQTFVDALSLSQTLRQPFPLLALPSSHLPQLQQKYKTCSPWASNNIKKM